MIRTIADNVTVAFVQLIEDGHVVLRVEGIDNETRETYRVDLSATTVPTIEPTIEPTAE